MSTLRRKRAPKRSKLEQVTGRKVDPTSLAASKDARDLAITTLRTGEPLDLKMRSRIIFWLEYLSWLEGELSRVGGRPKWENALEAGIAKALVDRENASVTRAIECALGEDAGSDFEKVWAAYYAIKSGKIQPVDPPEGLIEGALKNLRATQKK